MIEKKKRGNKCWITFRVFVENAEKVAVIGDWNQWQP